MFCGIPLLSFNDRVAEVFQQLQQSHLRMGTMDLKIAATALGHQATLLTRNFADFKLVPGLIIEDWTI